VSLPATWDFIIIGSGFGGSVSALRLRQKGYSVLVLERGRRFEDRDFPRTNWEVTRYLWAPSLRCYGILEISPFRDIVALHGAGVGGGSLGYANVLMQPDAHLFESPEWNRPIAWREALAPHYDTARRMLGVAPNPRLTPADRVLEDVAREFGTADTFRPAEVAAYFGTPGQEGVEVPDPGPAASTVADAWSAAGMAPRTPWSRTTSGWRNGTAPGWKPTPRSVTSGPWQAAPPRARGTRS
jgi:cholesterol oxidase